MERLRGNRALSAALAAITAAVVGVILNLALWFGLHVLFREVYAVRVGPLTLDVPSLASLNPAALLLFCGAAVALFWFRLGAVTVLLGAAVAGAGWQSIQGIP